MYNEQLPEPQDFIDFVVENPGYYALKFQNFSILPSSFHPSWHWPAFFATFWWFLYRKMYLWAGLSFVTYCIPYVNLISWVAWPIFANHLYFQHVRKKVMELKAYQGENYRQYLGFIGGVNRWVPYVAGLFFVLPILIVVAIYIFE